MSDAPADFWPRYEAIVAQLLPPLKPGDGVSEEDVSAAEARLNLRLPRILREFYLKAGNREDINRAHNRLLAPSELVEQDGALAFYAENQAVVLWGLPCETLGAEDPPVVVADNVTELIWEEEQERLSEFLLNMLLLQATLGGMRYGGVGECDVRTAAPGDEWQRFHLGLQQHFHLGPHVSAFLRDGQVLYVFSPGAPVGMSEVSGGGRTAEDFRALSEAFAVTWSYSSLEDEQAEQEEAGEDE